MFSAKHFFLKKMKIRGCFWGAFALSCVTGAAAGSSSKEEEKWLGILTAGLSPQIPLFLSPPPPEGNHQGWSRVLGSDTLPKGGMGDVKEVRGVDVVWERGRETGDFGGSVGSPP